MVVAHFAVRIAAVVILSKSSLFGFRAVAIRESCYLTRLTGNERVNFQILNLRIVKWPNPLLWCGGAAFSMITR
jgi:hypothetical protein